MVLVLEIPGDKEKNNIEDVYADTDSKEIIVKGCKAESIKPLYNKSTKFGKFNLHIPYGNKVQISEEDPIEGEDSFKDGIYLCKFKLIKMKIKIILRTIIFLQIIKLIGS